jgi:hypothetical protein
MSSSRSVGMERTRNANPFDLLATPAGLEPATNSLEECWETQSFQRKLQLFRCRKRVKIPGKLQLS